MPTKQEIELIAKGIKSLSLKELTKLLSGNNFALFNVAKSAITGGKGGGAPSVSPSGVANNLDKDLFKKYQSDKGTDIAYNVLNSAGTVADVTGKVIGTKNDLFGKALLAAANGLVPAQSANVYGNTLGAIMNLPALAMMARGAGQKYIGEGIDNIASNVAADIRSTDRHNKNINLLLEQQPSGQYFASSTALDKNARGNK